MSTLIRSVLVALVLTSAAGAATARPANNYGWVDKSEPNGGFAPNSAH